MVRILVDCLNIDRASGEVDGTFIVAVNTAHVQDQYSVDKDPDVVVAGKLKNHIVALYQTVRRHEKVSHDRHTKMQTIQINLINVIKRSKEGFGVTGTVMQKEVSILIKLGKVISAVIIVIAVAVLLEQIIRAGINFLYGSFASTRATCDFGRIEQIVQALHTADVKDWITIYGIPIGVGGGWQFRLDYALVNAATRTCPSIIGSSVWIYLQRVRIVLIAKYIISVKKLKSTPRPAIIFIDTIDITII